MEQVTVTGIAAVCRQRLANVLEAHGLQGCRGLPRFTLEEPYATGVPTLLMKCDTCGLLQVVV